jgi:adenylyl cyclase-associated protein
MAVPGQHVAESWNSAEFFANKLLREFRGVNEAQVAWVQALKVRLQALNQSESAGAVQ